MHSSGARAAPRAVPESVGGAPARRRGARPADPARSDRAVRRAGDDGAGGRAALPRAAGDRALPPRGTATPTGEGWSVSRLAGRSGPGPAGGRAAVPVRAHPDGVQGTSSPSSTSSPRSSPNAASTGPGSGSPVSTSSPRMRSACVHRAWAGSRRSATWPAARGRRSGGRAPAFPAAGRTRWRSSGCRGSGWSAGGSPRHWCTRCGHQGAAVLDLVTLLRADLRRRAEAEPDGAWDVWDRWISEIVADCWSVGTLGLTSTLGLMAVVSLPPFFVFRPSGSDPHPVPYLRVLVSAGIGEALYPHPQWAGLRRTWRAMYPVTDLPAGRRAELGRIEAEIPRFVDVLVGHRPAALHGARIADLWPTSARRPERLLARFRAWGDDLEILSRQRPALVFAVLGQAKAAGLLSPEAENRTAVRPAHRLGGAQQPRPGRAGRRRATARPLDARASRSDPVPDPVHARPARGTCCEGASRCPNSSPRPQLYRDQPANFRIRLAPSDPEGVYEFRFSVGDAATDRHRVRRGDHHPRPAPGQHGRRPRGALHSASATACCSTTSRRPRRRPSPTTTSRPDAATRPGGSSPRRARPAPGRPGRRRRRRARRHGRPARRPATTTTDWRHSRTFKVLDAPVPPRVDSTFALAVTPPPSSPDEELWFFIRRVTERMRFAEFHEFVQPEMIGAHGVDWTDTGAYEHLQRLSKRFLQVAADPQRAVVDPLDPSFGEISPTTARAGVQRSYVSDEDLDLAQPFLGFDGVLTAAFARDRATTTTRPRCRSRQRQRAPQRGRGRRAARAPPPQQVVTRSRCPTCRSWNCCGPTGWTSAAWRRR